MIGRIITSDECVLEGADYLAALEPRFASALAETGPLPLRLKPDGFGALVNAIVGQQVSTASAAAIWGRLEAANLTSEAGVIASSEIELREQGLSRPKARYVKALADARIDYASLRLIPNDQVIKTLVAITGIGPWTAEIYTMFSLGRADVFAPGDLALQEAARILFDLDGRPSEKDFRAMALAWSPWQSVAARILWAYYRVAKQREGIQ